MSVIMKYREDVYTYSNTIKSASEMHIKHSTVICPVGYPSSASDPG
jgi:hypothetical protein